MTVAAVFVVAAAVTWALRASFIALMAGRTPPPALHDMLASARHAVLGALVVTAVVGPVGYSAAAVSPRAVAAGVAIAVAWYTGGMLRTVAAGVLAMAALGWVFA